jgi:hypothetical protein
MIIHILGLPNAAHEANIAIPPMHTAMMEKALAVFHLVSAVKY